MPRKKSYLTVTDQFCGAGGSSSGAKAAGAEVRMALNHWKLAIETHNTNHPDTDHDCTDISACNPRRYPSTDILITSPECTNHSLSNGKKKEKAQRDIWKRDETDAAAERSRATMWDVVRFAEYHDYRIIIVENVVDARQWIPFDAWLLAMHNYGYNHQCVYLNSMHAHPTPQSRDRMYVVFWKKGQPAPCLDFRPRAHCTTCSKDVESVQVFKDRRKPWGKYGPTGQYLYRCPACTAVVEPYYYAAFNAIDWSDLGTLIPEMKPKRCKCCGIVKPMACRTEERVRYGLDKYGTAPMIVTTRYTSGVDCRVRDAAGNVIPTQPGDASHALFTPFLINQSHTHAVPSGKVRSAIDPIPTQTTSGNIALCAPPLLVKMYGNGTAREASSPLNTVTAGAVKTAILTHEAHSAFIASYYKQPTMRHATEAVGTVTTKDRHHLITYQQPRLEDCRFRMLRVPEIKRAMAFADNYVVLGNVEDKIKQLGNAVTPPAMEWLVRQCIKSLS